MIFVRFICMCIYKAQCRLLTISCWNIQGTMMHNGSCRARAGQPSAELRCNLHQWTGLKKQSPA